MTEKHCKYNAIANVFYLIAAWFFMIPAGALFFNWNVTWGASSSAGKAGMIFMAMTTSNTWWNLFGIIERKIDVINVFLSFISYTCYVAILTAGEIGGVGVDKSHWSFGLLWAGWCLNTIAVFINVSSTMKKFMEVGWTEYEKIELPTLKDLFCKEE